MNIKSKTHLALLSLLLTGCIGDESSVHIDSGDGSVDAELSSFEDMLVNNYQVSRGSVRKFCIDNKDIVSCNVINGDAILVINDDGSGTATPCLRVVNNPNKIIWNISKSTLSSNVEMTFYEADSCSLDGYNRMNGMSYLGWDDKHDIQTPQVNENIINDGFNLKYSLSSDLIIDASNIDSTTLVNTLSRYSSDPDFSPITGMKLHIDDLEYLLSNTGGYYEHDSILLEGAFSTILTFPDHDATVELIEKTWI